MAASSDTSDNILAQLDAEYAEHFAGKDRTSVDPATLQGMIERGRQALNGEAAMSESLATGLKDRLAHFEGELEQIKRAQSGGTAPLEFRLLGRRANLLFAQYGRHFAGKSRATRDPALLAEIIADLEVVQEEMQPLVGAKASKGMRDDLALVGQRLGTYRNEADEIAKAFTAGTTEQKATYLANRANEQFQTYANLFAGKSRLTRRPELLVRITGNLESIHAEMKKLSDDGFDSELNAKNMQIVTERLGVYRSELAEIRKVREARSFPEIMSGLGAAANDVFDEYQKDFGGKARTKVDLAQLERMLDELGELRRQMARLGSAEHNEGNIRNEKIVSDRMQDWINEHRAIVQAQSPQGDPNAPR